MRKYITLGIVIVAAMTGSCKKKKDPLPVTMTFVLGKDTLWTTNNVVTDNENTGIVYITATNADKTQSLDLTLSEFTGGKKVYTVDYRGPGGNMTGNTGHYRDGSNSVMARAGKITITEVGSEVMTGTFDLHYLQTNFKGTFTAALR